MNEKDLARFWGRVDVRGPIMCWEWTGYLNTSGYGQIGIGGKMVLSHRVSAWIHGLVDSVSAPKDQKGGGFVLHHCDNRLCCNPWHFEVGTKGKNLKDAYGRGLKKPVREQIQGERQWLAKLTECDVIAIRKAYAEGAASQRELGERYGVCLQQINRIVNKKSWTHI